MTKVKCGSCTLIVDRAATRYRSVPGRLRRETAIKQVCLLCVRELSGRSLDMQRVPMMALALFMQKKISEKKLVSVLQLPHGRGRGGPYAKHRTAA